MTDRDEAFLRSLSKDERALMILAREYCETKGIEFANFEKRKYGLIYISGRGPFGIARVKLEPA